MGETPQIDTNRIPIRLPSGLDEPAADRVAGELDPVAKTELLEDVGAVALNRLLADHELLGDLASRIALGDQLHDFELPRRQGILVLDRSRAAPRYSRISAATPFG